MVKKVLFLAAVIAVFISVNMASVKNVSVGGSGEFSDVGKEYEWAKEAILELTKKGVISGVGDNKFMPQNQVTKEQLSAMLAKACGLSNESAGQTYVDVPPERWSFDYVESTKDIIIKSSDLEINQFAPERPLTRAETLAACVKAVKGESGISQNASHLSEKFKDYADVPDSLTELVLIAVEKGIAKGDGEYLRPNDYVSRAEAAVIVYRMMSADTSAETPIVDSAHITSEEAQQWAKKRGAHQRFIDVAPIYWKYGELTGINPEIMYGQAAKETNFGKYTGNVKPEQNNWAGIKIYSPVGDNPEDHETFSDADEGVRAHFNHMCAYVGSEPVGEPHARYEIVKRLSWAGTIKYAEELSTKWAPAADYGQSLVQNYVSDMRNIKNVNE